MHIKYTIALSKTLLDLLTSLLVDSKT